MATKNANNQVKENIEAKLSRYFGVVPGEATRDQMYKAVAMTVKDILTEKRGNFKHEVNEKGAKRVYYMCVEFLLGRSLKTGICNLGMSEEYGAALKEFGYTLATDTNKYCPPKESFFKSNSVPSSIKPFSGLT